MTLEKPERFINGWTERIFCSLNRTAALLMPSHAIKLAAGTKDSKVLTAGPAGVPVPPCRRAAADAASSPAAGLRRRIPAGAVLWLGPVLVTVLAALALLSGAGLLMDGVGAPLASGLLAAGAAGVVAALLLATWQERSIRAPLADLAVGKVGSWAGACEEIARIAARLRAVEEAQREADRDRDGLTGLGGPGWLRRAGEAMLARSRCEGGRVALFLVDLDRFNDINGFHGHRIGDLALRQVARRLFSGTDSAALAVRIAGDRFAMLLAAPPDEAQAESWGEAAIERLGRPLVIEGVGLELGASVGIALFPDHGVTLEPLLRAAEMALSEVKRAGGGRARVFCKRMDASLKARKTLEREMRQAIENGDFVLHYQPQIDLRTGRIGGVEALLRWPHRSHGMVPPATFIPLAESSGLIRPLGAWVMTEACRAGRRWHDLGLPVEIAVNLSAAQLRQQEIVALVGRTLADTGLPPEALELELTESLFVDPSEVGLRRALERIAEMGIQLAIDDFGTGYSSLAYLKRLPFSKIKIDRSFLGGIGAEQVDEAIVRAIIGLAKTFRKRVLAEGVETEAQRQFLLREGCDVAQGYLFSRPVSEEAVTRQLLADAGSRGTAAKHPVARAG